MNSKDRKGHWRSFFAGRSQLIVYHFIFGPVWEAGCPHFQASFSEDEIAAKDALYNFARQDPGESEREGLSVFSRTRWPRLPHLFDLCPRHR
jgi:predicted dithiol-disulfide oxidoreductase (DUF899 family)